MRTIGRYEVLTQVASGNTGYVLAACLVDDPSKNLDWARRPHGPDDASHALKLIKPRLAQDTRYGQMLRTEAPAAIAFRHEHAARFVEIAQAGADLFLAMELVRGQTLSALMDRAVAERRPLRRELVLWIGRCVASALSTAHHTPWHPGQETGMLQGEVSPQSIMLTYQGEVRVLGVGLGRSRMCLPPARSRLPYRAPELFDGRRPEIGIDIYGLGVVLYDALSGARVFARDSVQETTHAVLEHPVRPLVSFVPDVGAGVSDLVQAMMRRVPGERPRTMSVVEEHLALEVRQPARDYQTELAAELAALFPAEVGRLPWVDFAPGFLATHTRGEETRASAIAAPGQPRTEQSAPPVAKAATNHRAGKTPAPALAGPPAGRTPPPDVEGRAPGRASSSPADPLAAAPTRPPAGPAHGPAPSRAPSGGAQLAAPQPGRTPAPVLSPSLAPTRPQRAVPVSASTSPPPPSNVPPALPPTLQPGMTPAPVLVYANDPTPFGPPVLSPTPLPGSLPVFERPAPTQAARPASRAAALDELDVDVLVDAIVAASSAQRPPREEEPPADEHAIAIEDPVEHSEPEGGNVFAQALSAANTEQDVDALVDAIVHASAQSRPSRTPSDAGRDPPSETTPAFGVPPAPPHGSPTEDAARASGFEAHHGVVPESRPPRDPSDPSAPTADNEIVVLEKGEVVGGRYRVMEKLGVGGMAVVYKVEHTLLEKAMALKLLRPELSTIPYVVQRFHREARFVSQLDDPRIVRVTDFGRAENGSLFLVMELIEGELLSARMRARSPMELAPALEIMSQVLLGLDHAHRNNVIHRDLKPDNIMLLERDGELQVKIVDFGIAKLATSDDAGRITPVSLTQAGMVFGSPRYMSPEQASGDAVDARTDIYAAGVIIYELLTGRRPFDGSTARAILSAVLTQTAPAMNLTWSNRRLARALEDVVQRAIAKDKEARFPTAIGLLDALKQAAQGA